MKKISFVALILEPHAEAAWHNKQMHNAAAIERLKAKFSSDNPVTTTPTQHRTVGSHVLFK